MGKHSTIISLIALFLAGVGIWPPGAAASESEQDAKPSLVTADLVRYSVNGEFSDIRDLLELAITGKGIAISSVSHIGEMLERTGKDLNRTKAVFTHAEAIEFCSAAISRDMLEADPHSIVFCPYSIFIYELPDQPNVIFLAYRKPVYHESPGAKPAALSAVETLLQEIIADTLE